MPYKIEGSKNFMHFHEIKDSLENGGAKLVLAPKEDISIQLQVPPLVTTNNKKDYFWYNRITHYKLVNDAFYGLVPNKEIPGILYLRDLYYPRDRKLVNMLIPKQKTGLIDTHLILVSWKEDENDRQAGYIYHAVYEQCPIGLNKVRDSLNPLEFDSSKFFEVFPRFRRKRS